MNKKMQVYKYLEKQTRKSTQEKCEELDYNFYMM